MERLEPQTGIAFRLDKGRLLSVTDLEGEQVADLVAFNAHDPRETISSGRSIDYANTIYLTRGHQLYSNRSRPMLTIRRDDVGRHDFLLTPCSPETFRIIYKQHAYHPNCFENLATHLQPFGIVADAIPVSFNIFMNVIIKDDGSLEIRPPLSRAGDTVMFRAEMDLIIGLTACSAELTNNGAFKPIGFSCRD